MPTSGCSNYRVRATLPLLIALSLSAPAAAADLDYRLGISLLDSDNIALAESGRQHDTILSPSLRLDLDQAGSALTARVRGQAQYLDYLDNTFSDEFRSELAGQIEWRAFPERMHIVVEDYLSSQPTDIRTAFNAGNEQQVNVFSAGPRFYARLAPGTDAQLELRYGNTSAQRTRDLDGDRYTATARILHDLSASRSIGLHGAFTDARFDRAAVVEYRRYDAYGRYLERRANLLLSLDLGVSELDRDGPGTDSEPLFRAQADWQPSPRNALRLSLVNSYADAATDLVDRANLVDGPILSTLTNADVTANAEVFRNARAALSWRYSGDRLTLDASPYFQRIRYQGGSNPDQVSRGFATGLEYRLGPTVSLTADFTLERRSFDGTGQRDRDVRFGGGVSKRFGRHWSVQALLSRRDRNSSLAALSYRETAISIAIFYQR